MSIPGYQAYLVEALTPRLFKGSEGEVTLRVLDLNGLPADLSIFDEIVLTMKNHPEQDETITYPCLIDADEDGLCYFTFTQTQSNSWLAAPYNAQLQFTIYDRDNNIATSATGYVPIAKYLYLNGVTTLFKEKGVITGVTSGFTATVRIADSYDYNAQKLTLCDITGVPTDGEAVTGSLGGSGDVYGALSDSFSLSYLFGDDSVSFSAVRANDTLTTDSVSYIVDDADSIIAAWLSLTIALHVLGAGISYTIESYDPATSGINRAFLSELFPMQVREDL